MTSTPPPEPPQYQWHPGSVPDGWGRHPQPPQPQLHSPTAPQQRRAGGIAGAAAAGIGAFLKYGLVILKLGKLGPTLISMAIALVIYATFFGPLFGVGIVLLILVLSLIHI